ncbi:hypothetical protein AAVH_28296, partial [Aphelenchoides avenae]
MVRKQNALPARLPRYWTMQPVSEVVSDYCDIRLRRIEGVADHEKARIVRDVKAVFRNEGTIAVAKKGLSR